MQALVDKLCSRQSLTEAEYEALIAARTPQLAAELAAWACKACEAVYGSAVYVRGLIEFSNQCDNNCLYCGIRRGNEACERYHLTTEEVLACAREGWDAGFRTFVLQSGESAANDEWVATTVRALKQAFPKAAVTLSVGERPRAVYAQWRAAGADRYLLRHETATPAHYAQLHPATMSWENRMACLRALRAEGYAVGAGFMVGSPFQTPAHLAADVKFVETFKPEMCGIGPFVPHSATPFRDYPAGSVDLTCYMLSLVRLAHPGVLLPATTALEALDADGRVKALAAGANVVMPNITPAAQQQRYTLYEGKPASAQTAAQKWAALEEKLAPVGRHLAVDRGDSKKEAVHG